jgi:putative membrane protein
MMYWNDHGMNGWGFGLMAVSMLLFWALLVVGGLALTRRLDHTVQRPLGTSPAPPPPSPSAEELLAERYARGEIDTDEYRHRLETLRQARGPDSGRTSPI